jgi:hypothetical protein
MTAIPYDPDHPGLSRPNTGKGRLQRLVWQQLLKHAYADDEDSLPTSNRFILYELEQDGKVTKAHRPGKRRGTADHPGEMEVSDASMWLRELGVVPWSWIEDETRTLSDFARESYSEITALVSIDPWQGRAPLILTESRSLGGVLSRLVSEYRCGIAPTNGQVGGFLYTDVAPVLTGNDRPVLYLGDLDDQGHQIENNTRRVLERETGREIDWTRIAITEAQVEGLLAAGMKPIMKADRRYRKDTERAAARPAWEAEALGQGVIVALVRGALDALLPEPLASVQVRERLEQARLDAILEGLDLR